MYHVESYRVWCCWYRIHYFLWRQLWGFRWPWKDTMTATWKSFILSYTSTKAGFEVKEGIWRQELEEKTWRNTVYWLAQPGFLNNSGLYTEMEHYQQWCGSSNNNHQPRKCTTTGLSTCQSDGVIFSNEVPSFQIYLVCHVDKNQRIQKINSYLTEYKEAFICVCWNNQL